MILSYPEVLLAEHWDRHKGAAAKMVGKTGVGEQLKFLRRKFEAVAWQRLDFEGYDLAGMETPELVAAEREARKIYDGPCGAFLDELTKTQALLDRTHKSYAKHKLVPKKSTALVAEMQVTSQRLLTQCKALSSTLTQLGGAIAKRLRTEKDAAETGAEDAADSRLLDPSGLRRMLKLLEKQPERHISFAFGTETPSEADHFVMSAKQTNSATLYKLLLKETGAGKGTHGQARFEPAGRVLKLQVQRPAAGVVRKARAPIKASGFRVQRIVLVDAAGVILESLDETAETQAEVEAESQAWAEAEATARTETEDGLDPKPPGPPEATTRPAGEDVPKAKLSRMIQGLAEQWMALPQDHSENGDLRTALRDLFAAVKDYDKFVPKAVALDVLRRAAALKERLTALREGPEYKAAISPRRAMAAQQVHARWADLPSRAQDRARIAVGEALARLPREASAASAALNHAVLNHLRRLLQPAQQGLQQAARGDVLALASIDRQLQAVRDAVTSDPVVNHLDHPPDGIDSQEVSGMLLGALDAATNELKAALK